MARPLEFDRNEALEKAMNVFWQRGYEATTLDDLTAAMGIKRQSLYNSFGDKHSLYLEALRHYRALRREGLLACLNEYPVKEGFRRLFTCIIDEATGDSICKGCMIVNAMSESAAADPAVHKIVEKAEQENEAVFTEAIRLGQQCGEIDSGQDAQVLAAFLYNTVIGLRVRARKATDRATLENIAAITLKTLDQVH